MILCSSQDIGHCFLLIVEKQHHMLNMDIDLPSLLWLHVHSCTHWLRPRKTPLPQPPHLGSYTRALLVSQDRRPISLCDPLSEQHRCGGIGEAKRRAYLANGSREAGDPPPSREGRGCPGRHGITALCKAAHAADD